MVTRGISRISLRTAENLSCACAAASVTLLSKARGILNSLAMELKSRCAAYNFMLSHCSRISYFRGAKAKREREEKYKNEPAYKPDSVLSQAQSLRQR